jgi:hypothetical protein
MEIGAYNDVKGPHPIDPPGGTIATRRSNALQLFVYISRTSARGTSAFLILGAGGKRRRKTKTNAFQISAKSGRKEANLLQRVAIYLRFSPESCAGWGTRLYNRVGI